MKAVVVRRYGGPDVLEWAEVNTPTPAPGEVLVKIRATSVNPVDWKIRTGALRLLIRRPFPLILGADLAGEVYGLGKGAGRFTLGEEVFGMAPGAMGAYAQFAAVPESVLARKPAKMTMDEAASVPLAALTALRGLRDVGELRPGQRLLVNGASGGVGIFAVQLGKILGATVTGVSSAANADLVRGLGADTWIDYHTADFTSESARYHVIFDCVGTRSMSQCRNILEKGGTYVSTLPSLSLLLWALANPFGSRKAKTFVVKPNGENMEFLRRVIDEGRLKTVIDQTFPIAQAPDAHARSQTARARGKIVMRVGSIGG